MTENRCYKQGLKLPKNKCKGLVVHSTASKGVMAAAWYARWNNDATAKLVAAFVDDTEAWQYAPWDMYGAHCGGAANASHIGFEICEDKTWTRAYFDKAYHNAVQLAAYLCGLYGLTEKNIISHKEGHALGLASNHGDPDHWWKGFGVTMDDFRRDVKTILDGGTIEIEIKENEYMDYRKVDVSQGDTLNVRATPSNTGVIVTQYAPGKLVAVLEENPSGWCRTKDGWCYGKYLVKVESFTITLPATAAVALKDALEAAIK